MDPLTAAESRSTGRTDTSDPARTGGAWRDLGSSDEIADALVDLYEREGGSRYDEAVTQTEHALQCGAIAMANRAPDPLIVAALLHDIGHLLLGRTALSRSTDRRHEDIGGRFLTNWFAEDVTEPIRMHVPAKRFLCATEPGYHAGLSPASVHSLELQGGPMSAGEVRAFREATRSSDAVSLRRWDDEAKVPGAPTPSLSVFRGVIVDVLEA